MGAVVEAAQAWQHLPFAYEAVRALMAALATYDTKETQP